MIYNKSFAILYGIAAFAENFGVVLPAEITSEIEARGINLDSQEQDEFYLNDDFDVMSLSNEPEPIDDAYSESVAEQWQAYLTAKSEEENV